MNSVGRNTHRTLTRLPLTIPGVHCIIAISLFAASCGTSESKQPDLPQQPDNWVSSFLLDPDSTLKYIGKTKDFFKTTVSEARELQGPQAVSIGDDIEGIRVGAIRCSFFSNNAFYDGQQYMWRGRWGCQAGRSREEIENSVGPDGEKRFDYLYISPVTLKN
ncbi:hypothetical protein VB734_13860 [Synechococcus sp. BA-124 BA4]|uniref:hypothetical protein n=1 Tax=unclassified Synechococcus TaxID=2626047 RepID=UPI002AD1E0B0|nr:MULTISPECIES: hypothetical protein [unclassified Synechococcus]MEA5401122.1 hypothetical protein [Synechococcus sp. BA-124 BA4]